MDEPKVDEPGGSAYLKVEWLTNIHPPKSGLLWLYYDIPGAPWNWSHWQEITGVKHGLFLNDNQKLPSGWTCKMANAIHSYFEAHCALLSEDSKHTFSSGKDQPGDSSGRAQWRSWVVQNWSSWKIQLKIHRAFKDSGCLWHQIMVADNLADFPKEVPLHDAYNWIIYTLFGSNGLNVNGKILYALQKSVHTFAMRNEAAIDVAFTELEKATPTKQKLASLVKLVPNWRKDIMIWNSKENLVKLAYVDLKPANIRKALGGVAEDDPFNPVLVKKQATKIKPKAFEALAKCEDVQDILALLDSHLSSDEQLPQICITFSIPFGDPVEGANPGVEVEAGMSYEQLCTSLLLDKFGHLVLFNNHCHVGRITTWSASSKKVFNAFQRDSKNAHLFKPIQMHWHQLAGAHAVLCTFFMLIADDVGLGKSFLAALVTAFLIELGMQQKKDSAILPLIKSCPYLGTVENIPDFPTLIVVPGTLQRQWLGELQAPMRLHLVNLFCYPSSKAAHNGFWADDSLYNKSVHIEQNRIIIVSHSEMGAGNFDKSATNPVVALQIKASKQMQSQFMGCLIRRKATSLGYDQKPLLVLPSCNVVDVIVQLQPWELEFVDNSIPSEAIDRLSQATALGYECPHSSDTNYAPVEG
ncbi:hypothetical protein H1R20_g10908, partial [Candolleomyces eurysporus]